MKIKNIIAILISFLMIFNNNLYIFAKSDTNIDNGGNENHYEDNNAGGKPDTILNNEQDEGVRVTVVDLNNNLVTSPIDFANNPRKPIKWYFGYGNKLYYKNGGKLNKLDGKTYKFITPDYKLPKIVSGNLSKIKKYFGSEVFLKYLSKVTGFNYKNLISGKYKLMLEPIGYPKINGDIYALTSTELAMLDNLTKGYIRKSNIQNFSHMNLPLSMFLEKDDFNIKAYKGSKNKKQTNDVIINQLGVGAITFKEEPKEEEKPQITTYDYTYRTDTNVITSIDVSGGESNPNEPISVYFEILGKTYKVENVFYPEGSSQLAWVEWHTPSTPQEIDINVTIEKKEKDIPPDSCTGEGGSKGEIKETNQKLKVKVEEIIENTPPNPVADDKYTGYGKFNYREAEKNMPKFRESTYHTWGINTVEWKPKLVKKKCFWYTCYNYDWEYCNNDYRGFNENNPICEHGESNEHRIYIPCEHDYTESHDIYKEITVDEGRWEYDFIEKNASLSVDSEIKADKHVKTAKKNGKEIKSGYGINNTLNFKINTNDRGNVTSLQNAVSFFPEFNYQNYFRLLEKVNNQLIFRKNKYSTYNARSHFSPIWYPDNNDIPTNYNIYTYGFDAWTPAGMLSSSAVDGVSIKGNLWDDYHVAPAPVK